jgi:hypothetical protein
MNLPTAASFVSRRQLVFGEEIHYLLRTAGLVIIFRSQQLYLVLNSQINTTTSDISYLRKTLIAPFRLCSSINKQHFAPAISPSSVSLPK